MQIAPPVGQYEPVLPNAVREELEAIYARVPSVSCEGCSKPGSCCELTQEEWDSDYATMYPLYVVEYLNIVDYVRTHFDQETQQARLSFADERPKRCPFLTDVGGCSIHSVRPLTCRTYGVLNRAQQVEEAAETRKENLPKFWVSAYLSTERYTVCDETKLLGIEKLQTHLDDMVSFRYERLLVDMSQNTELLALARRQIFEDATGKEMPTRWTWGAFNVLFLSSVDWLKDNFGAFWKKSFLGE